MIIRNARYKQVLPGVVGYKGNLYTKAYAKGELLFDYTNDEYETQYFTTESLEDSNTITATIGALVNTSDFTSISYSTDGGLTWTTLTNDGSTTQTISATIDAGEKVLWKGSGNRTATNNTAQYATVFSSTGNFNVYGNIMSLIKGDNFVGENTITALRTFNLLFEGCSKIIDASNLMLIPTTLTFGCYSLMFKNCSSLVKAPKLPATTLANQCYTQMFAGCTSLTEAPDLPATTLTTQCYGTMFSGCTSLVKASELKATTLATGCYGYMFRGCTSLTEAPELPATTLAQQCYQYMFQNCTSLNYIKCLATDISATDCTLNWVYNVAPTGDFVKDPSMNSWLIDNVNGIPIGWTLHGVATYTVTLTVNDANMGVADGAGTYSAGDQVVLRAEPYEGYSFVGWYDGSTLVSSETTYVFNIYSNISYEARFAQSQQDEYLTQYFTIETLENNNRVLIVIPADLTPQDYVSLSYSTDDGTNWTTISIDNTAKNLIVDLPVIGDKVLLKGTGNRLGVGISGCSFNCIKTYKVYGNIMSLLYGDNFVGQNTLTEPFAFAYLFSKQRGGTSYLVDASNLKLPATTLSNNCYAYMFSRCELLVKAPELPATTLSGYCYRDMFSYCASLTTAPSLPATTLASNCYEYIFYSCTSLTQAPVLPATNLAHGCYSGMFRGCTSLTQAPELPATIVKSRCYYGMFWGCTSLVTAPALPATSLYFNDQCYAYMFYNCTSLVTTPTLPATYMGFACYESMFAGCTSLTQAPELPATTLRDQCYYHMFEDCTSLTQAPELQATTLAGSCYAWMFRNTKIQNIKIYGVSSSWTVDFGTINYSNGIYYTKPNATSNILNGCPSGWTISKTL